MNDRPTLDEIRARCALPVTEVVANPREYFRVQTILRDRAELLRLLDECPMRAELEWLRGWRTKDPESIDCCIQHALGEAETCTVCHPHGRAPDTTPAPHTEGKP